MFITPFYSSKPLFSICNKEEYEASFHNCDLNFDDLKPNLDYVNENYSLIEEFFRDYMSKDPGFEQNIVDADQIELGKFISNEEKSYFTRIHDEIANKTLEAKMIMSGGSDRARKLMGRLLMRNDLCGVSDEIKEVFNSKANSKS